MDSMTFTKAAGSVCAALLILLLGKWAGSALYHVGGDHGGEQAYVIEVEDAGGASEAAEEVSIEELIASADLGKGEKVFKKCSACHKLEDGANGTGPFLYGVVGRAKASAPGFGYSGALSGLGGDWTAADLSDFLEKPKDYAPGTTMAFSGLKKPEDRANLIAFLDSLDN